MNILITAFEPFGGRSKNQSHAVAETLAVGGCNLDVILLPVSFENAPTNVVSAASAKYYVRLERLALIFMDSERADNTGRIAGEDTIIPQAPIAYLTGFPIKIVYRDLKGKGYNVKISNSAGTFVCNSLYYNILHLLNKNGIFLAIPQLLPGLRP